MTVEETSHGSLSAKTSLFMRIPVELKLHVLKAHTAFLHESAFVHVGKQARVTEAVGAFDEAGTPESISLRPDIQELILLHFPTAGRIMPTELFWTFMWNALITEDQELDTIGKRWKTLSMWHRRSAEVFRLRYLALVSWRVNEMLRVMAQTLGPFDSTISCHYGLLLFWRFTSQFSLGPASYVLEYFASLAAQWCTLTSTLTEITTNYALAAYRDSSCIFPFCTLRAHYRELAADQLEELQPHQLAELFITSMRTPDSWSMVNKDDSDEHDEAGSVNASEEDEDSGWGASVDGEGSVTAAWSLQEEVRPGLMLDIEHHKDMIVLRNNDTEERKLDGNQWLDMNRAWVIEKVVKDKVSGQDLLGELRKRESIRTLRSGEREVVDNVVVFGLDDLGGDELASLFGS